MTTIFKNNIIPLYIRSKDRIDINSPSTDFTISLSKSIRNISSINVTDIVIPATYNNISKSRNRLSGHFSNGIVQQSFDLILDSKNYTYAELATELSTKLGQLTISIANNLVWSVSYDGNYNLFSMSLRYLLGASNTLWGITFIYNSLMDTIGLGTGKTSSTTFSTSLQENIDFGIVRQSTLNTPTLWYNITSKVLTPNINTSYINNINKIFSTDLTNNSIIFTTQQNVNNYLSTVPYGASVDRNNQGNAVAISGDGLNTICGASSSGDPSQSGVTYIYNSTSINGPWSQLVDRISGSNTIGTNIKQGYSVAISNDNTKIATSAIDDDTNSGAFWVFGKNNNDWIEIVKLTQSVASSLEGYSLSMSGDGNVIAAGAPGFGSGGSTVIYRYNNAITLYELDEVVYETDIGAEQGTSVSISTDGTILAVGAPGSNNVYIYRYNGTDWSTIPVETIVPNIGIVNSGKQGQSVSISNNGTILAVGIPDYIFLDGRVAVYTYNGTNWTTIPTVLISNALIGPETSSFFGYSVSISGDGFTIATGDPKAVWSGIKGVVQINRYDGINWINIPEVILYGPGGFDQPEFGYSVSLNNNGQTIVVGSPYSLNISTVGLTSIYTYSGGVWSLIDSLVGNNKSITYGIGTTIEYSKSGAILIVGGQTDGQYTKDNQFGEGFTGAIWIYSQNGTEWIFEEKLIGDTWIDGLGKQMSISYDGTVIINGSTNRSTGKINIYRKIDNVWVNQYSDAGSGGEFVEPIGGGVCMSGNGLTAATTDAENLDIRIYSYSRVWSHKYTISYGSIINAPSIKMSYDGTILVVGIPSANTNEGETTVYTFNGTDWTTITPVSLITVNAGAKQGTSVDISNDGTIIIVGGPGSDTDVGIVYTYEYDGTDWTTITYTELIPDSSIGSSLFGSSVSISDPTTGEYRIAISGPGDDTNQGAIWTYERNSTGVDTYSWILIEKSIQAITTNTYTTINPTGDSHVFISGGTGYQYFINQDMTQTYTISLPTSDLTIFGISDYINTLSIFPNGITFISGYSIEGNELKIIMNETNSISGVFKVIFTNDSIVFDDGYDSEKMSMSIDLSINNHIIRTMSAHRTGNEFIYDNLESNTYRKLGAGYTIDNSTPLDIQLRDEFDRIIDLNGSDWVMTALITIHF